LLPGLAQWHKYAITLTQIGQSKFTRIFLIRDNIDLQNFVRNTAKAKGMPGHVSNTQQIRAGASRRRGRKVSLLQISRFDPLDTNSHRNVNGVITELPPLVIIPWYNKRGFVNPVCVRVLVRARACVCVTVSLCRVVWLSSRWKAEFDFEFNYARDVTCKGDGNKKVWW